MRKKKKEKPNMVDMYARINMKVVPGTPEEDKMWEEQFIQIQKSVEIRMRQYEEDLKELLIECNSEKIISVTEKDSEYFIEKYSERYLGRNPDNIKNRLELYHNFLKEQN